MLGFTIAPLELSKAYLWTSKYYVPIYFQGLVLWIFPSFVEMYHTEVDSNSSVSPTSFAMPNYGWNPNAIQCSAPD